MDKQYDFVVIGSGPAGHVSAIQAAQLGLKCAVIEKDMAMLGGVCLNEGCIPAKSLFHSARALDIIRRSTDLYGLDDNAVKVDISKLVAKSRDAAGQLRKGLEFLFKKNGIDLLHGKAEFIDANTLKITDGSKDATQIEAKNVLIATGSSPRELTGIPFDGQKVISSSDGIRLDHIPEKILIVGGGAIGTELAVFFNTLGTDVTVIEAEGTLLPGEDTEISKRLEAIFKRKGIKVLTSCTLKTAKDNNNGMTVTINSKDGDITQESDIVLVSVGRTPQAACIGLENAGIKCDDNGFIPVNGKMQTNINNIYAAGDCIPTPMLAHAASAEGEIAAESAAGKDTHEIDYSVMPNVVYTDIPVASIGLTEDAAKAQNIDITIGKQFFKANGRAVLSGETEGFIKILAETKTGKLVGVHIIGAEAPEMIHEFVIAKRAGMTAGDIAKTVHAHPTFSETIVDACRSVFGKPIHG